MMTSKQRLRLSGWVLALLPFLTSSTILAQGAPQKYALLIGINEYLNGGIQGVSKLSYAVKDAQTLEEKLKERGWITKSVLEGSADRERIVRELYDLALKAKLHDKVLVYFAGHGVRDPITGDHTYWLTYKASLATLVAEGIRLNHILEYVRDIPARQKIVLLDHCYSGDVKLVDAGPTAVPGDGSRSSARPELDTEAAARALFPPDIASLDNKEEDLLVVLGAARGPAYEHPDWGHGMLTKAVLDVLEDPDVDTSNPKDGKISLSEFLIAVKARVSTLASEKNLLQNPFSTKADIDQLSLALFDALVDAGSEAAELSAALSDLDMAAPLPTIVKWEVLDVIAIWSERQRDALDQSQDHLRVIGELRALRDHGVSDRPERKRQSLIDLLVRLELVQESDLEDSP